MKKYFYNIVVLFSSIFVFGQVTGSNEVGITEGQLSVSLTGAATYSIPIAVPPGINGVLPQITLTYSSQSGNGIAGYGWNISGVSSISRIPSTQFHDGVIDAVDYDALDRFALDGQRLIVKSGTSGVYGADGTQYETENYSNVKITSIGVHPNGANFGPATFKVEYPDGSFAFYGLPGTFSSTINQYSISYWQNPQGVRITYSYEINENNLYISMIGYGSTNDELGINNILFDYTARQRAEQAYVGGFSIKINRILRKIRVRGNNVAYRNYELHQESTSLGYERLSYITEKTGDESLSYNSTVFGYDTTSDANYFDMHSASYLSNFSGVNFTNTSSVTGDFDGDSKLDFILYPTTGAHANRKFTLFRDLSNGQSGHLQNTGEFKSIFASTYLTADNKVSPTQGISTVEPWGNSIVYKTYSYGNIGLQLVNSKTITLPSFLRRNGCAPSANAQNCVDDLVLVSPSTSELKNYAGDFNGDGITDVIATTKTNYQNINCTYCYMPSSFCDTPGTCYNSEPNNTFTLKMYFIDLKGNPSANVYEQLESIGGITDETRIEVADFNGDGKSDLYKIENNYIKIYTLNNSNQLNLVLSFPHSGIKTDRPVLLGDYNGDGKIDICIPEAVDSYNWNFYFADGTSFIVKNSHAGTRYRLSGGVGNAAGGMDVSEFYYFPSDFNGDGKTDILTQVNYTRYCCRINFECYDSCNGNPHETYFRLSENKGVNTNDSILFSEINTPLQTSGIYRFPLPIITNHNNPNLNMEYGLISGNKLVTFNSVKDNKVDILLKSITTGNGTTETITYKPLQNEVCSGNCNSVYQNSSNIENYPNFDILLAPTFKVVNQIDKQSSNVHKKQQYMYYGAVTNFQGLGFLGFRATMRTNWTDVTGNRLISYISKNDISLRGANIENYSVLGFDMPQNLTPSSNFITKTIIRYNRNVSTGAFEQPLQSNMVLKLKNSMTEEYNGLEGTSSTTITDFDASNDPIWSTTELKNGATPVQTTVSTIRYIPPTISPVYVVGRPERRTNTITLVGSQDVSSTEELYGYENHLLTEVKKSSTNSGQTTPFVTERNIYDDWGNITKKTISYPGLEPRVTDYEYDPTTHRFLTKSYDIEHLATEFAYDLSSGVLLTEKLPCTTSNLTTTHEYDKWFKKKKIIDYLGKEKTIAYSKDSETTIVTTAAQDDSVTIELFDDLGRKIQTRVKNINGVFSYVNYLYDIYDRNYKISEPFLDGDSLQWNETSYDDYGRVMQCKSFTGKIVTYAYSGLTTSISETTTSGNPPTTATNKTTQKVKNAMGQVISSTEATPNGTVGTIYYTYFANGILKTTNFDGNVTTIYQDGWGRKEKLVDTSAGIYEYSYNGFGETLTEVTPNGTTTYELDDYGKVHIKTISGNLTNSTATNIYHPTTKLLISTELKDFESNPSQPTITTYSYEYDQHNRLKKTTEDAPQALFERTTEFDDFGRSFTENYKAQNKADSKFSEKKVKNTYLKGFLWQILEFGSDKLIWQTDLVNARGQLMTAQYGTVPGGTAALGVENYVYDDFGLPRSTTFRTQNGSNASQNPFLTLSTSFSAQRGNLLSRNYSFYGAEETFLYDDLDRLIVYPAPSISEIVSPDANRSSIVQTYDNKGRIIYNNLGEYKYNALKPYQSTGIKITDPTVTAYYNNRTPQIITYNAVKRPVTINEQGIEKLTFEYNVNNDRSVMYYGDEESDKNLRKFRKFYSADGSMEIKLNVNTDSVEFITYVGGNGYTAPAAVMSDGNSQNYLYLHRDYQGTIVAISDGSGQLVEQRHFDAWGSLIKYAQGGNTTIPVTAGIMLLDRGYTGHEHLLGVALINMNGRLYDPKLHRFLSPDNYVQDPSNTQSFNRYGYCWNNPLAHTDPGGEWIHILAGAIIGGVFNWAIHGFQFNAQGLAYFGVGALAGGLAAMGAGGVSSALAGGSFSAGALGTAAACTVGSGFVSGAVVGAAGGFVGGFVGGIGNSLIDGKNIGDSFKYGIRDGALGAITGGIIGGVASGIDASMDGRDFWTGAGESVDYVKVPANSVSDNSQYSSNSEMRADYNSNIGSRDGMSLSQVENKLNTTVSLGSNSNLPAGCSLNNQGLIDGPNISDAGGVTTIRYSGGVSNRVIGSQIKIAPGLKGFNLYMRNMIFKHEFMHAWHINSGFKGYSTYTERATSDFSFDYCQAFGETSYTYTYAKQCGYYPKEYSWRNFAKIMKLWIK